MGTATKVNMTKLIELIRISMVLLVVLLVTISTNLYAQNKCSFKAPKDWIEKRLIGMDNVPMVMRMVWEY